jgi:hypothetical protein
MKQRPPAATIDEVLAQLEALIASCIESNSRMGYFAALYHKVTAKVRDGILKNEFENGARMEKFDVIFANRYLDAVLQWNSGINPSAPWLVAFQATRRVPPLLLQHLLLAMNAHINLDLGIAAVELARTGHDIQTLRKDFVSINNILGSLALEVTTQINKVSPLLSLFGLHASNNALLIQFSISNARDGSWNFAEELHGKHGDEYEECIRKRGETIKKLGEALITTEGLLIRITMFLIYLFEWKIPRKIIRVLAAGKKAYVRFDRGKSSDME